MRVRTTEKIWQEIDRILVRSFIDGSDRLEWGIIGMIEKVGEEIFLIRKIFEPNPMELDQSGGGLVFSSSYIRRAQLFSQQNNGSGLIFFHTHPFAIESVSFSGFDDEEEPLLIKNLQDVWSDSEYISIVVGKNSYKGRRYCTLGKEYPLSDLYVIGRSIKVFSLNGKQPEVTEPSGIFDRAMAITPGSVLGILQNLKIAIIGAGGTGSLMVELLRRSGCQNLLLIDDDIVEVSNLNRLLFASSLDVKESRKKVYVALDANHNCALGNHLEIIDGDVTRSDVLKRLNNVDMLIGCVDKDYPRYVLNELAVNHFLPYVDLGTEIGVAQNKIQTLDARVTYIYPGGPCLKCRELISAERIRLEGLSPGERRRHIGLGYCEDIDLHQPAVMDLNMRAASFASLFIRHLFQPFLDQSGEMDFRESLTSLTFKRVGLKKKDGRCDVCG